MASKSIKLLFGLSPSGWVSGVFTGVVMSFGTNILAAVATGSGLGAYALPGILYIVAGLCSLAFFGVIQEANRTLDAAKAGDWKEYCQVRAEIHSKKARWAVILLVLMVVLFGAAIWTHINARVGKTRTAAETTLPTNRLEQVPKK